MPVRRLAASDVAAFAGDELLSPGRARPVVAVTTNPHDPATWTQNPKECAVVAEARALRAGGRSLRAIEADLDESGVVPTRGVRLHQQTVASIARVA